MKNDPDKSSMAEFNRDEMPRKTGADTNDPSHHTPGGGGITNRPLDEEQQNQQRLPPRGEEKH